MNKTKLFFAFLLFFMFVFNNSAIAQETCCGRLVATAPISMPKPQESDCSSFLNGVINMVLTENFAELDDCPIEVEIMDYSGWINANEMMDKLGEIAGAPKDAESPPASKLLDYVFKSSLFLLKIDDVVKGEWETGYEGKPNWVPGNVHGSWELRIDLVDSNRGTVVRSGSTTWSGNCAGDAIAAVTALVKTQFMPLDDIIYDYERIPETASIIPGQPEIETGTEATFSITEIKDQQGRQSAQFQRLLVTVDKGRIVNGFDKDPYKVFEVGPAGIVQIRYQAPDECKDQTANLQVFNSCNITDGLNCTLPEKQLATAEIHIHCTPKWQWKGYLSITWSYHYNCKNNWEEGDTDCEFEARDMSSATGVISFVSKESRDLDLLPDLDESNMNLNGTVLLLKNLHSDHWWKDRTGICDHHVVTPGGWIHKIRDEVCQGTCLLENATFSLSFSNLSNDEDLALAKEFEQSGFSEQYLSNLEKAEKRAASSGYVRVIVLLGLDCPRKMKMEYHDWRYDCCEGTKEDVSPESIFTTLPAYTHMYQLEGTISRQKNGQVIIEAAAEGAKIIPDGYTEFTLWGCPSRLILKDNTRLVLRGRRIK